MNFLPLAYSDWRLLVNELSYLAAVLVPGAVGAQPRGEQRAGRAVLPPCACCAPASARLLGIPWQRPQAPKSWIGLELFHSAVEQGIWFEDLINVAVAATIATTTINCLFMESSELPRKFLFLCCATVQSLSLSQLHSTIRKHCKDWLFLFYIQNMRLYKRKCLDVSAILFLMKTFLALKKRGHCTSLRVQIIAYAQEMEKH